MEKIIIKILEEIIENLSPQIRAKILEFLDKLEIEAKESVTPWDNLAVKLAKAIIGK